MPIFSASSVSEIFFLAIKDESLIFIAIATIYSQLSIYKGMNNFAKKQNHLRWRVVAYLFLTKFYLSLVTNIAT